MKCEFKMKIFVLISVDSLSVGHWHTFRLYSEETKRMKLNLEFSLNLPS